VPDFGSEDEKLLLQASKADVNPLPRKIFSNPFRINLTFPHNFAKNYPQKAHHRYGSGKISR
jgi:hypothetical protein